MNESMSDKDKSTLRLNKYISECGVCSRREADRMIEDGRVLVNGRPAEAGMQISDTDQVVIDGKEVKRSGNKVVIAYYKPKGLVCSKDGQGAKTVFEDLKYPVPLTYIGRLDKDSEGLLLLTNDGDLANAISRARNEHEKEYEVTVNKLVSKGFLRKMAGGVPILDTVTRPCEIYATGERSFTIILTQGLNRQIRRMCEACGYYVRKLKRIRVMNIELGDLKKGEYRELTQEEVERLRNLAAVKDTTVRNDKLFGRNW